MPVLLSEDERAKLEALASADHRTAADWIRVAIVTAYAEQFGDKKPPKVKRRR